MYERPNPLRILIVEDSHDDTLLLVDYLEEHGLAVQWQRVESENALLLALKNTWHMVLSDYSIPGFGGKKALDIIREQQQDIPFIFVSGTLGEEAAVESIKAGANDYVMKGNLTRLVPIIDRELRDFSERKEKRYQKQYIKKLSLVVEQTGDSVVISRIGGFIEYVNPAFESLSGYTADEVISKKLDFLSEHIADKKQFDEIIHEVSQGNSFQGILAKTKRTGEQYYEESVIAPLNDDDGNITHLVFTGRDITERILVERDKHRLSTVMEATPDLVAMVNPSGDLIYLNRAGQEILGVSSESSAGQNIKHVLPQAVVKTLVLEGFPIAARDGAWCGDTELSCVSGVVLPVSMLVIDHRKQEGGSDYISLIARDLSERKKLERQLHYTATHDAITDLPNRFYFFDHLSASLLRAFRHDNNVAVLLLDIDHFKRINLNLGASAGDRILSECAKRLKQTLRPSDMVARHGGDEFALIVEDIGDPDSILVIMKKLRESFKLPVLVEEHEIFISFSIGIVLCPLDGDNVKDLMRRADSALSKAKSEGGNSYRFFSQEMDNHSHELLSLEADLRHALENDEFVLHFQPQVSLALGKLIGFEALIRWQHPIKGLLGPGEFIGVVESSGLIHEVGEHVLRLACQEHQKIQPLAASQIKMSVNVSPLQFANEDFFSHVQQILKEEGMPPELLELEITENMLMRDPFNAAKTLHQLKSLGLTIAIDDFGTGYSSLAYLKEFPVDILKIDRSFVRDIKKGGGEAIVEASISMAKKLGIEVVAEGVETAEQLVFLQSIKCDVIQGYIMSRPVPSHRVEKLLHKNWF